MNENKSSSGIGCSGFLAVLLTVAFVVLKLCGVITWSWWWVLSPAWIYAAIVVVILLIYLIVYLIVKNKYKNK